MLPQAALRNPAAPPIIPHGDERSLLTGRDRRAAPRRRLGYRSGDYGRTPITRVGKPEPRVPQDRDGRFSTEPRDALTSEHRREELDRKFAVLQEMANGTPLERIPGWEKIRVSVPLGAMGPPPDSGADEW